MWQSKAQGVLLPAGMVDFLHLSVCLVRRRWVLPNIAGVWRSFFGGSYVEKRIEFERACLGDLMAFAALQNSWGVQALCFPIPYATRHFRRSVLYLFMVP